MDNYNANMENHEAKFLCSYGGEIQPRNHDNELSYVGGYNKILYVDRSIKLPAMLAELSDLFDGIGNISFKYQFPGKDLDALISVTNDNEIQNMMLEYDHLYRACPKKARMRLFLFPNRPLDSDPAYGQPDPGKPNTAVDSLFGLNNGSVVPPPSWTCGKYDAFISFRGEDTRANFTSPLYEALSRNQIKTFIDDEPHKRDYILPSLMRAIENSRVSVVVFSQNYASSKWCLEELVKILECRKEHGQHVIPVFYNIHPSHVQKQLGSSNEAFKKHLKNFVSDTKKVQKWKEALIEAANFAGWDSRIYRDDSELIQKIVDDVVQKLNYHYPPNDIESLVGIYKNLGNIESLLSELPEVQTRVVGIWGMGGIGKTTLAKIVYEKYSDQYEGSCFLGNVRERSEKYGQGLYELRNQLYSELKKGQNNVANSTYVECRVRRKRVLVVLDDVSDSKQLEYLVGGFQCYGPGSKVIITTRDKSVLEKRVERIYKMKALDFQESLTLFSLNAFNKDYPQMRYEELSRKAVVYCKGIPLALKVLGCFLHSKSETEWDISLQKLEKIPNAAIQSVLRLSYDGLEYQENHIVLDIACFFKGEQKEHVVNPLDSCGCYAASGMSSLLAKALIATSDNFEWMHDLHKKWVGKLFVRNLSRILKIVAICGILMIFVMFWKTTR